MSPRWPRKNVDGEMWCPSCVQSTSHVQKTSVEIHMRRLAAGWSGEDLIRHELGRQKVHTVNGESQICPEHLRIRRSQADFATGLAAQVGLPRQYDAPSISPPHEGRCEDCSRVGTGTELPWDKPARPGTSRIQEETSPVERGWHERRHRPGIHQFVPVDTTIRSLNMRVAIAQRDSRPWRGIRVTAHDSGDGETIFHCPFCGSGQVLARSDGTVECEFCSTAFTVQVQPQMPAFPQTIDGVPVEVPGMPAGGANANVPPGGAPGMDPAASGPPGAEEGMPGEEDEAEEEEEGDVPPFLKGSMLLRTAAGAVLTEEQYMRHLALTHSNDRGATLAKIREENGAL